MEKRVMMVSSASRVLSFCRKNPYAIDEEIFQDLADFIEEEGIRNEKVIRCMIASATETIKLKRNTNKTEKQI